MPVKDITTLPILKRLRPPRMAYLIGKNYPVNYLIQLNKAIANTWGGKESFVFIPISENGITPFFAKALSVFDPDSIEAKIHPDPETKKLIDGITNPLEYLEVNPHINPTSVREPHYPYSRALPIVAQSKPHIELVTVESEDELTQLLFIEKFGYMSDEQKTVAAQQGIVVKHSNYVENNSDQYLAFIARTIAREHPKTAEGEITALMASGIHLGRYDFKKETQPWRDPYILFIGDSVEDYCAYRILAALRGGVLWCPHSYFSKFIEDDSNQFLLYLSSIGLGEMDLEFSEKTLILTSISLSETQLATIKDALLSTSITTDRNALGDKITIDLDCISFIDKLYRTMEVNNFYDQDLILLDGKSKEKIETAKPLNFEPRPQDIRWLTEVYVETLELPAKASFNDVFIWQNPNAISGKSYRSSKTGFVYSSNSPLFLSGLTQDLMLVKPYFYRPNELQLFEDFFKSIGYYVKLSDKGSYQYKTRLLFADDDEYMRFFTTSKNIILMEEYTTKGVNVGIDEKRRYLSLADFSAIYDADTKEKLDELLRLDLIFRGLILKCNHCRIACFYRLDVLSDRFSCKRCNTPQKIDSFSALGKVEPNWHYGLNEIIYQYWKYNSKVPLQTLKYLKLNSKRTLIFVPELELRTDPNSERPVTEIDLCFISDGRIGIGECKSANDIDASTISKYQAIASAGYIDLLIFSTNQQSLNPGTLARISTLTNTLSKGLTEVKIFTSAELNSTIE